MASTVRSSREFLLAALDAMAKVAQRGDWRLKQGCLTLLGPDLMLDLSVIVPVFQEGERAPLAVERILKALPPKSEVIVVDDGSTDGSADRLPKDHRLRVIVHQSNRGKGRALRTGFEASKGRYIAFHDVDDEYSPSDLPALIGAIETHQAIAATGTRCTSSGWQRMTRANQLGNRFFSALFNWVHDTEFSDVCCGTKVFARSALNGDLVRENGWGIDVETLALLSRRGSVVEVSVEYNPRTLRDGKKIRWYHGLQIVRTIWRVRGGG